MRNVASVVLPTAGADLDKTTSKFDCPDCSTSSDKPVGQVDYILKTVTDINKMSNAIGFLAGNQLYEL